MFDSIKNTVQISDELLFNLLWTFFLVSSGMILAGVVSRTALMDINMWRVGALYSLIVSIVKWAFIRLVELVNADKVEHATTTER